MILSRFPMTKNQLQTAANYSLQFRPHWGNLLASAMGLVFFVIVDVVSAYFIYTDPAHHNRQPLANAILFASLWTPFILLALYGVAANLRESVYVDPFRIAFQGIFIKSLSENPSGS
jgi:hypothetical protein